ncbi:MAG: S41 family peptidase [Candidatus Nomurabacteria bacterium]|jgi:carboxyl-terminal processing protease|nr:S41 family peptidase [Candidatus Nomurabacteria bacterium]
MKERKVNLGSAIIGGFVTLVIGLAVGLNWNGLVKQFGPYFGMKKVDTMSFDSLNEVYEQLVANYDGNIDKDKILEEAKRGLVNAAGDTYTYYLTRVEAKEFTKSLNGDVGVGVGIEIGKRDSWTKVLRTTPDNPARKAGILAGDIIYKVNGEDVSGLTSEEVANLVRGAAGTEVTVTVVRDNDELSFTMVREAINNVSAYIDYKGDVGVLTITRFDQDTGKLTRQLAEEAKNRGVKKIILDLRGNGGGYVNAAKDVLSLWIDGKLVAQQKSQDGVYNEKTYATRGQAILENMKTVVLVNGSSASAAEIVAGALQDYEKATLIGEKTYGKGSVQSLINLDGGEMLRVTIAKWYTPNGKNINGEGIEPDKKVERTFEQINKEIDPQLEAALKY